MAMNNHYVKISAYVIIIFSTFPKLECSSFVFVILNPIYKDQLTLYQYAPFQQMSVFNFQIWNGVSHLLAQFFVP